MMPSRATARDAQVQPCYNRLKHMRKGPYPMSDTTPKNPQFVIDNLRLEGFDLDTKTRQTLQEAYDHPERIEEIIKSVTKGS